MEEHKQKEKLKNGSFIHIEIATNVFKFGHSNRLFLWIGTMIKIQPKDEIFRND
jgi:hypothetical protein